MCVTAYMQVILCKNIENNIWRLMFGRQRNHLKICCKKFFNKNRDFLKVYLDWVFEPGSNKYRYMKQVLNNSRVVASLWNN